ncbi:MAG TPA: glycosyltransferase family 4 protein [Phycisphaerales bacterium]|nr:glycosyltransferase family 4 protein [Phycisphaerales bacterium]
MERKKKLLFLCQVFYPDSTSTSQLFTSMFADMAADGIDIEVLCSFPSGSSSKGRLPRREIHRGVLVRRFGFRIDHKKSIAHRTLAYLGYMIPLTFTLLFRRNHGIVFGVTNPPFVAQILYLVSLVRRMPYQYMILDQYPESLIALGMKRTSLSARLWMWANRVAYRKAEKLIVLGRDMTELLVNNYGIERDRIVYIPHWSAFEAPDPLPIEASQMVDRLGLRDKIIFQYSGNMGMWHDINIFVRAAKQVEDDPGIHFLFIGDGARLEAAKKLSKELACKNVTWHPFVPLSQVRESLSSCHVALISLRAGFEGVAVPSKLYGILMSGRAIIAQVPAATETALQVEEDDCGIAVLPGDLEGLVKAVRELAADPRRIERLGRNAFAAYKAKYTEAQASEAFCRLWGFELPSAHRTPAAAGESVGV